MSDQKGNLWEGRCFWIAGSVGAPCPCFEKHGEPASFYTDGLSLFGHTSAADRLDTINSTPNEAWSKAMAEGRSKLQASPEPTLLNLRFALHLPRRVSSANSVEFLGRTWRIAPTKHKNVLIVHHPCQRFWITAPAKQPKAWPDMLGSYSL